MTAHAPAVTVASRAEHVQKIVTPGGVTAWLVESYAVPLVALEFSMRGGAAQDPADKPGAVTLLSGLLDEGAGPYDARGFHRAVEDLAIHIGFGADRDTVSGHLQTLSKNPVHTEMFNLMHEMEVGHISLADRADAVLIAPATADTIAKAAHGLADDLLTTVMLATKAPIAFAPSMNVNMWDNPLTQANVKKLQELGWHLIEPDAGELACGYEGKGRLPDPTEIVKFVEKII